MSIHTRYPTTYWHDVVGVYVYTPTFWRTVTAVSVHKNGTWQVIGPSDPQTTTVSETDSDSYQASFGWRGGTNVYQGSYNAGDHIGCMVFSSSLTTTLSGRAIDDVRITMTRLSSGGASATRYPTFWRLLASAVTGSSLTKSGQPDLWNGSNTVSGTGYAWGTTATATLPVGFGEGMRDGDSPGIATALSETLSNPGGIDTDYMIFSNAITLAIDHDLT